MDDVFVFVCTLNQCHPLCLCGGLPIFRHSLSKCQHWLLYGKTSYYNIQSIRIESFIDKKTFWEIAVGRNIVQTMA